MIKTLKYGDGRWIQTYLLTPEIEESEAAVLVPTSEGQIEEVISGNFHVIIDHRELWSWLTFYLPCFPCY